MTEYTDAAVGSVLKTLDDLDLSDNTLVFLASDNGPPLTIPAPAYAGGKASLGRAGFAFPRSSVGRDTSNLDPYIMIR